MAASAMPVLPDDGSMMVWPGSSRPSFSAVSIIDFAMRSFTEPNGFCISILARMRTFGLGDRLDTSTIGVLPTMSSTLSFTSPGIVKVGFKVFVTILSTPSIPGAFRLIRLFLSGIVPAVSPPPPPLPPETFRAIRGERTHRIGPDGSDDGDGFFEDLAVDDAVAASLGRLTLEADDHVVPRRIGRGGDVGGARVRL